MPVSDYADVRPDKSVPPKKSHCWRLPNRTSAGDQRQSLESKDSKSDVPLNMGSSSQTVSQNGNHQEFEKISSSAGPSADLPLDFSCKPNSRRCLSENTPNSPQERHSPVVRCGNPSGSFDREQRFFRGGDSKPRPSVEADYQQANRSRLNVYEQRETTVSPQIDQNSSSLDMVKSDVSNDQDSESSTGRRRHFSYSPRPHSPNSSPILAGMLSRSSPDVLPTMSMEAVNSRLLAFGLQNGYTSGRNSMFLPGAISSPNPVIPTPAIFSPGGIVVPPAMAFMPPPLSMLGPVPPVPPPCKAENKVPRKVKQERPFKNYDVSLQDDLNWPLPFVPRAMEANPFVEVQQSEPRNVPHHNGTNTMNSNSNSLPDSSPEQDNVPHSSLPGSSPPEATADMSKARGRKRKPVADSEKDESYWERRKKNNQAAKRSRENRRIKEDTVAQQAIHFRAETGRLQQVVMHQNATIHEISIKITRLEQDKLALTAENAMFKQLVNQKRCGQCGNHLTDKPQ